MRVFDDMLARLARGETFIDPSRWPSTRTWSSMRVLPYVTLRLAVMACDLLRADLLS